MLVGLVGAPSAGKSTFFKAATLVDVAIANYPFTTIQPHRGIGNVRVDCVDKEFGKQCNPRTGYCKNGIRYVPVEILDVAGLVPGASEGKGMGNQFLNDLNQADALIHVVDASGQNNELGESVGNHDPCKTVRMLEEEIDLWFLSVLEKAMAKFERQKTDLGKAIATQMKAFRVDEDMAKDVLRKLGYDEKPVTEWDRKKLAREFRLLTKPMLIAANKSDSPQARANIERMRTEFPHLTIIACSADYELALREAAKRELIDYLPGSSSFTVKKEMPAPLKVALDVIKKFLAENKSTGVQEVLDQAVFKFLDYIAVFPGGVNNLVDSQGRVLPDCFLLKRGSTAKDFAMKIHTDIGKNMLHGIDVKTRLKIGKDHVLKHRDVVEIVSTA